MGSNMTKFEELKNMNIDEFSSWLDEHGKFDGSPWIKWWDETYCQKCESIIAKLPEWNVKREFAWCEIEHKCRFFPELDNVPDNKEIIKRWLETEVNL